MPETHPRLKALIDNAIWKLMNVTPNEKTDEACAEALSYARDEIVQLQAEVLRRLEVRQSD